MLERIKTLLGISDAAQDTLLKEIITIITARVNMFISEEILPDELEYIVVEASVNRFNRLRSEGTTSHSVEGESWTWAQDELAPYRSDIQDWLNSQERKKKGRVRFI